MLSQKNMLCIVGLKRAVCLDNVLILSFSTILNKIWLFPKQR